MNILGLHDGKDSGVCLLADGRIVFAANEERYTRQKLHYGFPFQALQKLYDFTGITARDIDHVTLGFEAMVEQEGGSYDYEAEPRLHQKVYSVLSRGLGGFMDSKVATAGALQILRVRRRVQSAGC
jgi:predicted NodU family carbamoyl transferase